MTRRRAAGAVTLIVGSLLGWRAHALDLAPGAPDLRLRLDTTLRYDLGVRTDPVNTRIGASPAFTGGEYSVAQGGVSTNRLDLLVELDLAWRGRYGARASAVGWYDQAYADGKVHRSPALAGIPGSYVGDRYSDYTLERYRGPWVDLLDAFAFARVDAGSVPVVAKVGRHALSWGESLMLGGVTHGVAYSQAPIDLAKAFATPGVEAKELFRPLWGASVQAQLLPGLSLAGQYLLEWQPYLYPEGATFLAPGDFGFEGPDGVYRPPPAPPAPGSAAFLVNGGVSAPREAGDWGVALRFGPPWLDATVGVYYRRYTDRLAAVLLTGNPGGQGPYSPELPSPYQYRQYYAEGVDLVGLSLARQLLGVSVGAEISYRHDTPLVAQSLGLAVPRPAPVPSGDPVLFPHGAPRLVGNSYQARGDTLHAVLNAVGLFAGPPAVGTVSWAVELTWSRWLSVRENQDMFFAEGFGVCRGDPALGTLAKGRADGCATRDHVGVGAGLTPTWYRALPGVDLLLPLAVSWTIDGNSPVTMGGNEGSGNFGAGVGADVQGRWRLDLRYVDFFGETKDDGTKVTSANGLLALLKSRGSVTFTAKATY